MLIGTVLCQVFSPRLLHSHPLPTEKTIPGSMDGWPFAILLSPIYTADYLPTDPLSSILSEFLMCINLEELLYLFFYYFASIFPNVGAMIREEHYLFPGLRESPESLSCLSHRSRRNTQKESLKGKPGLSWSPPDPCFFLHSSIRIVLEEHWVTAVGGTCSLAPLCQAP